jgi:RHH-type rel operon transcriptional repressor/antitoxin RelB
METRKNEGFGMAKTLNVRISDEIERRLEDLAEKTKRPKSFYIKDMLEKYLDEYEEAYLALDRISEKNARYYTSKEVKKLLEL